MPEAEACDRVGIIDKGKLVDIGAPKELIAKHPGAKNLEDAFLKLTGRAFRDEGATARELVVNFGKRGGEHTR
jgi:ABC-2 type transport system ATP-binding protein